MRPSSSLVASSMDRGSLSTSPASGVLVLAFLAPRGHLGLQLGYQRVALGDAGLAYRLTCRGGHLVNEHVKFPVFAVCHGVVEIR